MVQHLCSCQNAVSREEFFFYMSACKLFFYSEETELLPRVGFRAVMLLPPEVEALPAKSVKVQLSLLYP